MTSTLRVNLPDEPRPGLDSPRVLEDLGTLEVSKAMYTVCILPVLTLHEQAESRERERDTFEVEISESHDRARRALTDSNMVCDGERRWSLSRPHRPARKGSMPAFGFIDAEGWLDRDRPDCACIVTCLALSWVPAGCQDHVDVAHPEKPIDQATMAFLVLSSISVDIVWRRNMRSRLFHHEYRIEERASSTETLF
nr:hypothetical protein CFP56_50916 [Quercus suber]